MNPVTSTSSGDIAERILLVDDNPTNLQVLSKILDGRGYELLVATNGDAALSVARKASPALVLLDIMMPEVDGFEVCRRLKDDEAIRDAAVIFLSALGDTKNKVQGLQLGAVDYITKPFHAEEVIARVETHLKIRRLQRDLHERNLQLAAANAKTTRDLRAAARVQHALLPQKAPETGLARFAWVYRPCDELAGDALNVFAIDDRHVGLFVLDVSGHGVVASLLSVAITHALTPRVDSSSLVTEVNVDGMRSVVTPAEVVGGLNRMFPMKTEVGQFVTVLYGVLNTETGVFRYSSAGHPSPIIAHAAEVEDTCLSQGLPIGVAEDAVYGEESIELKRGTRIVLFSDGLIEQMSPVGELFGTKRLVEMTDRLRNVTIERFVDDVESSLLAWAGNDRLGDDFSVLAFDWGC